MDIKQLVNLEIVKSLLYSSNKCVTVNDAEKALNYSRKIYNDPLISSSTAYRILEMLCGMGECRKTSDGYIPLKHNLKNYKNLNKIISNEETEPVARYFYAFIKTILESDKPLTIDNISKIIKAEYKLKIDNRKIGKIADELTKSSLINIYENDNGELTADKDSYISKIYLPDDETGSTNLF